MAKREEIVDNLEELLDVLPPRVRDVLIGVDNLPELLEIVLDLGRLPEARFPDGFIYLSDEPVTRDDIDYVVRRVGEFGDDNRAGIERRCTAFRPSATARATSSASRAASGGRCYGTIDIIRDVIESGESILLLGRPGVGKTTMLRETARVLADELHKRVVIVDTSNEIAGDGDVPHPAIGHARRMQVPDAARAGGGHDRSRGKPHARSDRHRRDRHRGGSAGRPHHRRAGRAARRDGPRQRRWKIWCSTRRCRTSSAASRR